jgi:ABC-type Fe3+ transport system permease subunit
MLIVIASLAVALTCFIIYAIDRRVKNEKISWDSALKVTVLGGLLTSGVVFATGPEVVQEAVKVVSENVPLPTSDMFVGVPTF